MKPKGFMVKQKDITIKIVRPQDKLLWKKCEDFEYRVFVDCGYIEPNEENIVLDYKDYRENSEMLAAYIRKISKPIEQERIAGIIRAICAPNETKMRKGLFPTVDKAEELKIYPEKLEMLMNMDPRTIGDIGTMAIDPEFRDSRVSKALLTHVNIRAYEEKHTRYALAAVDTKFYSKLKERGYPFNDLGPSTMYMGSPTTATLIDSYATPKGIQRLRLIYYIYKGKIRRAISNMNPLLDVSCLKALPLAAS